MPVKENINQIEIDDNIIRNEAFNELFINIRPKLSSNYNQETAVKAMEDCVDDIRTWMVLPPLIQFINC